MPAVLCCCGCNCSETVAYYGLGQMEPEDKGDSSFICENCLSGFHEQDRIEEWAKQKQEEELRTKEKKCQDEVSKNNKDDPRTILDRRLTSGEITMDEYDRIKERLDSE